MQKLHVGLQNPYLCWDRLVIPKLKGGIGLPDIHRYYWSYHLARIDDWHLDAKTKDWFRLEESFSQLPIHHLLWIRPNGILRESTVHPLIGPTLQLFRAVCKRLNLASSLRPLTPIDRNPDFPPGLTELTTHGQKPSLTRVSSYIFKPSPPDTLTKRFLSSNSCRLDTS